MTNDWGKATCGYLNQKERYCFCATVRKRVIKPLTQHSAQGPQGSTWHRQPLRKCRNRANRKKNEANCRKNVKLSCKLGLIRRPMRPNNVVPHEGGCRWVGAPPCSFATASLTGLAVPLQSSAPSCGYMRNQTQLARQLGPFFFSTGPILAFFRTHPLQLTPATEPNSPHPANRLVSNLENELHRTTQPENGIETSSLFSSTTGAGSPPRLWQRHRNVEFTGPPPQCTSQSRLPTTGG